MVPSPVDDLILTGDGTVLTGCFFTGHRPRRPTRRAGLERDDAAFADAAAQLGEYFAGDRTAFDLAARPVRHRVPAAGLAAAARRSPTARRAATATWPGRIGATNGFRAVGLANGRNPISIIVPCHRVIGADGSLTGYGGGMDRKRFLLDLEAGTLPFG